MLVVWLLALLNLVFGVFFLNLFFHVNRLEKKLDSTLQKVEIYLLNEYGEVPSKVVEDSLEE